MEASSNTTFKLRGQCQYGNQPFTIDARAPSCRRHPARPAPPRPASCGAVKQWHFSKLCRSCLRDIDWPVANGVDAGDATQSGAGCGKSTLHRASALLTHNCDHTASLQPLCAARFLLPPVN